MATMIDPWEAQLSAEIRRRIAISGAVDSSNRSRHIARLSIADPTNGFALFLQDWCWTFDPRNTGNMPKDLPFVPWPRQLEFAAWLQGLEEAGDDGVVDKSRDVGVTWLVVFYVVWRWLTVDGWSGSVGSRKAELLDRLGDPKSVFWKIEYAVRMLPPWLRPLGFDFRKHRNFARLVNPENGATITGEAGPEMGRGGRSSFYFLDEFGVMPRAKQVRAAVADNARSVVYASTATGPDTEFYSLIHEGNLSHFRLSWRDDPRRDDEWRAEYLRKYGAAITAREVDIDYSGGGDDVLIPHDWVRAAVGLDLGDTGRIRTAGLDVADSGEAETVYVERLGASVVILDAWKGKNPVDSAAIVADRCQANMVESLRYDSIGVGAGVAGVLNAYGQLSFDHVGVNVGLASTSAVYDDAPGRSARERFANLKAELWWALRLRFWNSYRLVVRGDEVDPAACISIPDDQRLISQLCTPRMMSNERGLLKVESKASLQRRGVASPDRADALVLAFAPTQPKSEVAVYGSASLVAARRDWR